MVVVSIAAIPQSAWVPIAGSEISVGTEEWRTSILDAFHQHFDLLVNHALSVMVILFNIDVIVSGESRGGPGAWAPPLEMLKV